MYKLVILAVVICKTWTLALNSTSEEDDIKCRGLPCEEFQKMEDCMKRLKAKIATHDGQPSTPNDIADTHVGDVVFNLEECEEMTKNYERSFSSKTRKRRKAVNFYRYSYRRWPLPIRYHIRAGYFQTYEINNIKAAFRSWEENTCLRFEEVASTYRGRRLDIRGERDGCWSYVGRSSYTQPINLQVRGCTGGVGIPLHEIGHAVGLYHEQSRPDRDRYITVHFENIDRNSHSQFYISSTSYTYGVPYDYASIMHYSRTSFSSNKNPTISTKDRLYAHTFGQRNGGSFMDFTAVNRMYNCLHPRYSPVPSCRSPSISCKNGGYPDPGKDSLCKKCMCPDGLTGDCTQPDTGSSGCTPVSGTINVLSTTEQCLTSPGYPYRSRYNLGDHCNWILKAPQGFKIMLRFDLSRGFGMLHTSSSNICYHYVEIRYNGNLTETGPRFCGSPYFMFNQNQRLTCSTNEALVIFRSEYRYVVTSRMKGFKLCYKLDKLPTTTSSSTTTTTPMTTTATPTTTTTSPTTTTTTPMTTKTTPTTTTPTTTTTTPITTTTIPMTTTTTPITTTTTPTSTTTIPMTTTTTPITTTTTPTSTTTTPMTATTSPTTTTNTPTTTTPMTTTTTPITTTTTPMTTTTPTTTTTTPMTTTGTPTTTTKMTTSTTLTTTTATPTTTTTTPTTATTTPTTTTTTPITTTTTPMTTTTTPITTTASPMTTTTPTTKTTTTPMTTTTTPMTTTTTPMTTTTTPTLTTTTTTTTTTTPMATTTTPMTTTTTPMTTITTPTPATTTPTPATTTTTTTTTTPMTTTTTPMTTTTATQETVCYECTHKYHQICLFRAKKCTGKACHSFSYRSRTGQPIRTVKKCVDECLSTKVYKSRSISAYCCIGNLCNNFY